MSIGNQSTPQTPKTATIASLTDHIIETYRPHESPCVLMWREIVNSFNRTNWPDCPLWTRDDRASHEHWKKFGPGVISELRRRHHLTVVKVSGKIRDLVRHGAPPDRGGRRTDIAYRKCLPCAAEMVRGIVVFPRDSQQDHPLIVASLDRRGRASATGLQNAIVAIDTANDCGVLSLESRDEIRGRVGTVARQALEESHPLFPRGSTQLALPQEQETA